ncbi:MAG: putative DNA binding domain-containing protein [Roseburia sp.]|nr:putative DNA binding domain-containing protein [Roseburia sp.]
MRMREDIETEFKRQIVADLNKEVIAFANTDGGKIFIGIDDDGTVVGVGNADETMQACVSHIRNTISPDITAFMKVNRVELDGKEVIEITVEKGTASPYYISGKGIRPEGVYVRVGSSSVPATETGILKMIRETDGESFESVRSLDQDLTFSETAAYFENKNIPFGENQKKTLGIINGDGLYTNLGLLLSNECTHSVKIAVFEGIEKQTFKDRYEFTGSLLRQLNECYAFIDRYNRTQSTFSGLERVDIRDFPVEAIREALLNSIVHREYALSGSTLINIFDDRMEFVSLGGLPKGIEYEDIMLGVSMPRNKKLADIFYRLKLIESYGTGISKIMQAYSSKTDKPIIEVTNNAFKITLPNTKILGISEFDTQKFDTVMKQFENSSQITRADVEKLLGVSYATAARILAKMTEQKLIMRVGNTRNTIYIKYKNK